MSAHLAERALKRVCAEVRTDDFRERYICDEATAAVLAAVCDAQRKDTVVPRMELVSILTNALDAYAASRQDQADAGVQHQTAGEEKPDHLRLVDMALWFYREGLFVGIKKPSPPWERAVTIAAEVTRDVLGTQVAAFTTRSRRA
jgi:hypothetical protein